MNAYQFNTQNMFHGVAGVLKSNREIYSEIPMVVKTVEEFISVVDQISVLGSNSGTDTSGVTSEKSKVKELLAHKTRYLGGVATAYAFDLEDRKMAAALAYSFSDIRYAKDAQTYQIALAVLSEIEAHADELVVYGITPEELAAYKQTIEDYRNLLEDKVEYKAIGVAETKQLAYLLSHGNDLLKKKIDNFFFRFKSRESGFYEAYLNARMIIDL